MSSLCSAFIKVSFFHILTTHYDVNLLILDYKFYKLDDQKASTGTTLNQKMIYI